MVKTKEINISYLAFGITVVLRVKPFSTGLEKKYFFHY